MLQLPLKVLLLTLFCLGTVAHHLKINQLCNILYHLLIHQEPVSAFEEKKRQGNKKFTSNSTQAKKKHVQHFFIQSVSSQKLKVRGGRGKSIHFVKVNAW